ncbi:Oxidoreductase, molybdopterin-binding domain-containing protein, partial [Neohortaea acidophila]
LHEIQEHNRKADNYWVYRGNRVYDITDWIPNHPGGDVIMRAVGGSIEPYWNIFTIHQKQDVYDILEQYFIGLIDPRDLVDGRAPAGQVEDPFKLDPTRDPELIVHSDRPFNAETPTADLETFITPIARFYKRHHLWVPKLDEKTFKLTVELPNGEEVEYSVEDLRSKFKAHTITATMQCSGNRRSHMTKGSRPTNGIQWGVGAISNAEWTGVKMLDVLQDAGLDVTDLPDDVKHVQFMGAEAYGASVPIEKIADQFGDALIVYAMNGQTLPRDHGFPLRALIPGTVAARSVKWLSKIVLSEDESTSQWQQRDYKCFGPNEGSTPDWSSAVAIQETPVQSAITSIRKVTANRLESSALARVYGLEEESVVLRGYAFSGAGRRVVRVDVSPDNGKTWQQANIEDAEQKGHRSWSWRQWNLAIPTRMLSGNVCVKATDDGYNTQPENFTAYYNFRGNLANSWHRVPV